MKILKLLLVCLLFLPFTALPGALRTTSLDNPLLPNSSVEPGVVSIDIPPLNEEGMGEVADLSAKLREVHNIHLTIRVEGPGGSVFVMNDLARAIEDSQKNGNVINMEVISAAASADAFIVCYADNVTMDDGSSLLFHEAYGMSSSLFGLIQIKETATSDVMMNALVNSDIRKCQEKGILTDKDGDIIRDGRDVVITMEKGKLHKYYTVDGASFSKYGLSILTDGLADIIFIFLIFSVIVYIIRKVGK